MSDQETDTTTSASDDSKTVVQYLVRWGKDRNIVTPWDLRAQVVEHLQAGANLADIDIIKQVLHIELDSEQKVDASTVLDRWRAPQYADPYPPVPTDLGGYPAGGQARSSRS